MKKGKHHRLGFWLSVATASAVVLGMIVLTALPFAMKWEAERLLVKNGAKSAKITDVDFNPMTGHLAVIGLKVQGPNADRVSVERIDLKVDILPLLKKHFQLRNFSLIGLSLDIRQWEDGHVTAAGFPLPGGEKKTEQRQPGGKTAQPWGLALNNFDIKDVSFHLMTPDRDEVVTITHLNLEHFQSWSPDNTGQFLLRVGFLGGAMDVEGSGRFFSDPVTLSAGIRLRDAPLGGIMPYLKGTPVSSMSGALNGRGTVNVTLHQKDTPAVSGSVDFNIFTQNAKVSASAENKNLQIEPGSLNVDLSLKASLLMGKKPRKDVQFGVTTTLEGSSARMTDDRAALQASFDTLTSKVDGSYSDTGSFDPQRVSAKGVLSVKNLTLKEANNNEDLFRLGSLEMDGISFAGSGQAGVSRIHLGDMDLLPRPSASAGRKEPAQIISLKSMNVTGLRTEGGQGLSIDEVQLDSLAGWVLREKDGRLEAVGMLDKLPASSVAATTARVQDKGPPPEKHQDVYVKRISLAGDNRLTFRDLSVDPPFNFTVDSMNAEIRNLGTGEKAVAADVSANAQVGKYSSASLDAKINPPWKDPDVESHVKLKDLDLPPLTPYTKKYLGYILRSGHLDTDLDIKIVKGNIDSKAHIVVNRIEMDPVKAESAAKAEDRLGVPVKTALTLLRDKNDDIRLTLPIKGSLKDPEFKISDVVVTAMGLALKKGLTAYYKGLGATILTGGLIPPGTFSILGKLFSGATTMTFDPVIFSPLVSQIDEKGKAHLALMAKKLREKPGVRLIITGMVSREDMEALRKADFEAAMKAAQASTPAGTAVATGGPVGAPSGGGAAASAPGEAAGELTGPSAEPLSTGPPSIEKTPLSDSEKERLIELAKKRAVAVKDYLTEVGGLKPERLFVCYSDVDSVKKDLPPRVDLSI